MLWGKTKSDRTKHNTALELAKVLLENDKNFAVEGAAEDYYNALRYNEFEAYNYMSLHGYEYMPMQEKWSALYGN